MFIVLQILLLVALPVVAFYTARRRKQISMIRPLDIGLFFACVVSIYGSLPLAGYAIAFAGYGEIADGRLVGALPEEGSVAAVGWMYVAFLAGFVCAYALIRRNRRVGLELTQPSMPVTRDAWAALSIFALIYICHVGVRIAFGIGAGDSYLDSYAVVRSQPLIIQQILGVLSATQLTAAILVIITTIAWRPNWHALMALFVILLISETFFSGGSRRDAFLCGLAYVVTRSVYGPQIKPITMVGLGVFGVLLFAAAGLLRQSSWDGQGIGALSLLQDGEFLMVFGNPLDLQDNAQMIRSPEVSLGIYMVDILRLVPRQIVGDYKVDPAVLYASTMYPDLFDQGGGLAFGAISEAAIGFGAPEALVRGLLLGVAYGLIRRLVDDDNMSFLRVFVYIWFLTLSYEGLRDTTFTLFPRFAIQVFPLLMVIWVLGLYNVRSARHRSTSLLY